MNVEAEKIPSNWDVTLLCDVALGKVFQANPELSGAYLDIDPDAIQSVLDYTSPGSSGELIVTAMHEDNVQNLNPLKKSQLRLGLTYQPDPAIHVKPPIEVYISAGGGHIAATNTEIKLSLLKNLYSEQKSNESGKEAPLLEAYQEDIGRMLEDPAVMQIVAVHELRHAATIVNGRMIDHANLRLRTRLTLSAFALGLASAATVFEALDQLTDTPLPLKLGAVMLAEAVTMLSFIKKANSSFLARQEKWLDERMEDEAHSTHSTASELPQIINIIVPRSKA